MSINRFGFGIEQNREAKSPKPSHFATIMEPQEIVRSIILSPKRTTRGKNGTLDLSYITPRLIAAASPTDHVLLSVFRTPLYRLISHMNEQHTAGSTGYWHVWNLQSEDFSYHLEDNLSENWSFRPFPDHQPPSLILMIKIVTEIDDFLKKNPHNVALVHCHEGKGRSGTICCAYLMFESMARGVKLSALEAIQIFTKKRMRRMFGEGVSSMCQIRYLDYWEKYLNLNSLAKLDFNIYHALYLTPFNPAKSQITEIFIYSSSPSIINSKIKLWTYDESKEINTLVELSLKTITFNDFNTSAYIVSYMPFTNITAPTKEIKISCEGLVSLAYAWFNLYFESLKKNTLLPTLPVSNEGSYSVTIPWEKFDGVLGIPGGTPRKLFGFISIRWKLFYGS